MSVPTVDFAPVGGHVESALTDIESTIDEIIAKDESELDKAKQDLDDKSGWCDSGDVEGFMRQCDELKAKLRGVRPHPRDRWDTRFKTHHEVPRMLHLIDLDWESANKALDAVYQKVSQMSAQTHWQGRGAEAYMKELPYQQAAVAELYSFTQTQREELARTATLGQAIMVQLKNHYEFLRTRLRSILTSYCPPNTYFHRTANAHSAVVGAVEWLDAVSGGTEWQYAEADLKRYHEHAVGQVEMFAADTWPTATNGSGPIPPSTPAEPQSHLPQTATPTPATPIQPYDSGADGVETDPYVT